MPTTNVTILRREYTDATLRSILKTRQLGLTSDTDKLLYKDSSGAILEFLNADDINTLISSISLTTNFSFVSTHGDLPAIGNPNDIYIVEDENTAYRWDGAQWSALFGQNGVAGHDGLDGTNGADGLSINWLGEYATAPSSPDINDAYFNTTTNASYIFAPTGNWNRMVDGNLLTPPPTTTGYQARATSGTLAVGTAVYVTGFDTVLGVIIVDRANASDKTKMPCLGLVSAQMTTTSVGEVMTNGELTLDTSLGSVNDGVWVSPTVAGEIVFARPYADNEIVQKVGTIIKSDIVGKVLVYGTGRYADLPNYFTINSSDTNWLSIFDGVTASDPSWLFSAKKLRIQEPTAPTTNYTEREINASIFSSTDKMGDNQATRNISGTGVFDLLQSIGTATTKVDSRAYTTGAWVQAIYNSVACKSIASNLQAVFEAYFDPTHFVNFSAGSSWASINLLSGVQQTTIQSGVDSTFSNAIKLGTNTYNSAGTVRWTGSDFEGYDGTTWKSLTGVGTGGITGSGTAGTIPLWTGASTQGDSGLTDDGSIIASARSIQTNGDIQSLGSLTLNLNKTAGMGGEFNVVNNTTGSPLSLFQITSAGASRFFGSLIVDGNFTVGDNSTDVLKSNCQTNELITPLGSYNLLRFGDTTGSNTNSFRIQRYAGGTDLVWFNHNVAGDSRNIFTINADHSLNIDSNTTVKTGRTFSVVGALTAGTVNGIALTTGGSASTYLDGSGNYSTPSGGGNTRMIYQFGRPRNGEWMGSSSSYGLYAGGVSEASGNTARGTAITTAGTLNIVSCNFDTLINTGYPSIQYRINGGTWTNVGTITGKSTVFTGLGISVSAGDYLELKFVGASSGYVTASYATVNAEVN